MITALTRAIPDSFAHATMEVVAAIDVPRARTQHLTYVRALESLGASVVALPADNAYPDCCFVEDCAVVVDGVALITRSGAESRRGETPAVARALEQQPAIRRVVHMNTGATLDGGDCMRIGDRMFVGLSRRTNEAGIATLRETFRQLTIVSVKLGQVLHLKCVCSPLGDGRVLLADETIPIEVFDGLRLVTIPYAERYAANCVAIANSAIIASGFPETKQAIEREGMSTVALDMSEIRKADGSLTCLSILL